jgi:hypothetical protein
VASRANRRVVNASLYSPGGVTPAREKQTPPAPASHAYDCT